MKLGTRKHRLKQKTLRRRQRNRKLAILKQARAKQPQRHPKLRQRALWRVGAWNVRRWGAIYVPYDPWTKTCALLHLASRRTWNAILLADTAFNTSAPQQVRIASRTWTIIPDGRVAIALDEKATWAWNQGGFKRAVARPNQGRALLVLLPRIGYHKGLGLIAVYAPTTDANRTSRQEFYTAVTQLKSQVPTDSLLIIGGDFNAEVGANATHLYDNVFGPWVGVTTNRAGEDFATWCTQEELAVMDSKFPQTVNKKYTWWHPSRGTGHILDHIATPQAQRKYVDMVKTVHEGRRGNAGDPLGQTHRQKRAHPNSDYWDDYTDHLPVEIKIHHFPKWKKQRMEEHTPARKPNVSLLSCTGPQSQQLKKDWQDKMDLALQNAGGQQQQLSWEILTNICIDTGCQVLGETPTNHKRPHLLGHEDENRQLDREVGTALAALKNYRYDVLPRTPIRQQAFEESTAHARRMAKKRRITRLKWKWTWIDNLTDELNTANREGNSRKVFQIHKQLGMRTEWLKVKATTSAPADPISEREAWKNHFKQLQAGREQAADHVWHNVISQAEAGWLAQPPTDEEIAECGRKMKNGKAAGADGFIAEFYKYGSTGMKQQIHNLVKKMWAAALEANPGLEAEHWPAEWSTGIVVPLWKNKGSKQDKNTYRGITLLSVGSKLLARVVAQRVQIWSEPWLAEEQMGFRRGRGVDDVLQVTRRIVEEGTASRPSNAVMLIRLFDIEKAYPRVSRDSLWKLMSVKGSPTSFIQVCKALHEHTKYQVRIHKGLSTEYEVDKGLREGCPSSPPLFNVYHHAVLEDFRARRLELATQAGSHQGSHGSVKLRVDVIMISTVGDI